MRMIFKTFSKTSASSSTAVPLSSVSLQVSNGMIKCPKSNTGNIKIGDSSSQNFELAPGESLDLSILLDDIGAGEDTVDLANIYMKPAVNSEGAVVAYCSKK